MVWLIYFLISVFIIAIVVYISIDKTIKYNDNVFSANGPVQTEISNPKIIQQNGFQITPLYNYNITARVLSKKNYDSEDIQSITKLSNWDLALGWNKMTLQSNIDDVKVSQYKRWYMWKTNNMSKMEMIQHNSSNVHIIPGNSYVNKFIESNLNKGDFIHMEGYLVSVTNKDGFNWRSSTTRDDVGNGSCEVFYVTTILKPDTIK